MKTFERTEKMMGKEGKAAWQKGLKNFLTQNGIVIPEDDVWEAISHYEVECVSIDEIEGETVIRIGGWLSGEPNDEAYSTDWKLIGECNESTDFEWEYYTSVTAEETENASANTVTEIIEEEKEDKTMMNNIIIATADVNQIMELARITKITKLQDAEYVDKANMIELAKANGMTVNRKTTRTQALEFIGKLGNSRYAELKKTETAPAQKAPVSDSAVTEAQRKTVTFMRKVLNKAALNQKGGHGYTISAEFVKYFIFEVQFGIKSFKGYVASIKSIKNPEEQQAKFIELGERMEKAKEIAVWMIDKGYIKPVTYKVNFDYGEKHFERSFYMPEFDGSDEAKAKMFPANRCVFSGSVNIKKNVTTYAVTEAAQAWR